jgi:hypothetical protein
MNLRLFNATAPWFIIAQNPGSFSKKIMKKISLQCTRKKEEARI